MRTVIATAAIATLVIATAPAASAQSGRQASFLGDTWRYHLLESGGSIGTLLTGQPSLHEGHPDAIITIVSRNGQALTEADRADATRLARGLCEQTGRHFNTRTRGHWLPSGGLGFQGACSQW